MGLTKNWYMLNLFHAFYQCDLIDLSVQNYFLYPFKVRIQDGSLYQPGLLTNRSDYYQTHDAAYGNIAWNPEANTRTKIPGFQGCFTIALGSGNRDFTEDDYNLESIIIEDSNQVRSDGSSSVGIFLSNYDELSLILNIVGTNTTSSIWNVNEVGIYTWVYKPTSTFDTGEKSPSICKKALIFREVLPNTLVVNPEEKYSIKFKISYNCDKKYLTKNWYICNLYINFYTSQVDVWNNFNRIYPYKLITKDGSEITPRISSSATSYRQNTNGSFGNLRYDRSSQYCQDIIGRFTLAIGNGSTPASSEDYTIESLLIEDRNGQCRDEVTCRFLDVGILPELFNDTSMVLNFVGTNNTNNNLNINEIAIYIWVSDQNTTGFPSNNKDALIFRATLKEPKVVKPNDTYSILVNLYY